MRQTFVRRCHGGSGSSRAGGVLAIQNMTAGQSALEQLSWGASAGVITRGCPAVHWHIDFSRPASTQDLLLCAKHLFVAAMVAWFRPGPAWRLWISIIKVWVHVAWITSSCSAPDRGRWSASTVAVSYMPMPATLAGTAARYRETSRSTPGFLAHKPRQMHLWPVTVGPSSFHSQGHETRLKPFFWTKPHFLNNTSAAGDERVTVA